MQTKSSIARIAAALAIAVVLPLAILITMFHSGKKPLAHSTLSPAVSASNVSARVTPEEARKIAEQYGRLPMTFEPNQGQKAPEVKFYSHGPGYELFLANQEAVMSLHRLTAASKAASLRTLRPDQRDAALRSEKISVVRMKLDGSNPSAQIAGEAQLPGKVNYFIGKDPKKWHTDIPTFASVKYSGVYPGVDLVYYGNQKQLEYDFVVAPGADPKQIAFNVAGAKALRVNNHGDLVLKTAAGDVTFQKPVIYQDDAGGRLEVAGNYVVGANHDVHFVLGAYDPSKTLTIDPVLIYSTYLGGTGASGDFGYGIALDGQGNAWVAGWTSSSDFFQSNGLTPVPPELASSQYSGFVTELNPAGTTFLYSTFLGGSGNGGTGDGANGIAVDTSGNVYVTGFTESADFPVTPNAAVVPPPATATTGTGSAFVTALHPATPGNTQLVYSSYLGGNGNNGGYDTGYGVATDDNGDAYVSGITTSTDFPTLNPIVPTQASAFGNAFVTEVNTTGPVGGSLVFSTFLGGTGGGGDVGVGDVGQAIILDSAGHTYVTGSTTSTDFAPTPASGTTPCGDAGFATAFIVEIDTTKATPTSLFSYCYGGALGDTVANGIAIAPDKTAVIVGQTLASDFPVTAGSIPVPTGVPSTQYSLGYVTKFNTTATPVVPYSTLLGGTTGDTLYSVATDSAGDLYVGGLSQSIDFPVTQGALVVNNSNNYGTGTISKINPLGGGASDLLYASYFGGAGQNNGQQYGDTVNGVAVSTSNNAYITGATSSAATGVAPFPVSSTAPQTSLSNTISNAFIAELPLTPTITIAPLALAFGSQPPTVPSAAKYVTVTNNTTAGVSLAPSITGTNAGDFTFSTTAGPGGPICTGTVAAGTVCTVGVIFTPAVTGPATATLKIIDGDDGTGHPWLIALTGTGGAGPAVGLNPTSLTFAGTLIGATSAPQTVTVTNTGTAALVFGASAIAPTVANFAVGSDTCSGTSVAPAGTCTFAVTLAPPSTATAGPTSGTIQITNNASNSPQSVAVSGTVWDFSLTVPPTATVNRGTNTSISVLINGAGGFTGSVTVACSSAASNIATCSVSPMSGTPTQTVNVTITGVSNVVPLNSPDGMPPFSIRQIIFAAIAMMLLFVIPMTRRTRTRLGLAAAMLVFAVVAGCSGSTKTKTTTLTITGTVGTVSKTYTTAVSVGG
jgi:predicted secreted protein